MKFIRFLLFPFAIMYTVITSFRNFLFDVGVFKSTSFQKPIIAVGNLSVGGTGKSPQIEYLIQLLKGKHKLAVLSRGYGRKTKGFVLANEQKSSEDIGDEPLQFYRKFDDITVAVDENRVRGIQQLEDAEMVLLDDAFQHRKVKAGFYILLTKYNDLFSNDFVLPTGNLRERRVGAKRADVIVVTKCPNRMEVEEQNAIESLIRRYFKGPIFFSTIQYANALQSNSEEIIQTADLKEYEVLLVTGIANPTPLLEYLSDLKCNFKHIQFPDHHQFTEKEIGGLQHQFSLLNSEKRIILTTEKDFVRLSTTLTHLYYLAIETRFVEKQQSFDKMITDFVGKTL